MKKIVLFVAFIACCVAFNGNLNATNVHNQETNRENNSFNWGDHPLYKDALLRNLEYNLDDWLGKTQFDAKVKKQVRYYVSEYIRLIREDKLYYKNGMYIDKTGQLTNKKMGTDYPGYAANYISTIVKDMIKKGMYYKD